MTKNKYTLELCYKDHMVQHVPLLWVDGAIVSLSESPTVDELEKKLKMERFRLADIS